MNHMIKFELLNESGKGETSENSDKLHSTQKSTAPAVYATFSGDDPTKNATGKEKRQTMQAFYQRASSAREALPSRRLQKIADDLAAGGDLPPSFLTRLNRNTVT